MAKYLGVAPWDMLRQDLIWAEWISLAMAAESEVRKSDALNPGKKPPRM